MNLYIEDDLFEDTTGAVALVGSAVVGGAEAPVHASHHTPWAVCTCKGCFELEQSVTPRDRVWPY